MQLKPLTKGRFHNIWQQDDALIEKIFQELLSETQMIHEDEYLYPAQGIYPSKQYAGRFFSFRSAGK